MDTRGIESIIDKHWNTYSDHIDRLATQVFNIVVRPWLKDNEYIFVAGNGDYFVWDKDGLRIEEENIPQHILDVLNIEISGMKTESLGTIMPNYPRS